MQGSYHNSCPSCGNSIPAHLLTERGVVQCPNCGAEVNTGSEAVQVGNQPLISPPPPPPPASQDQPSQDQAFQDTGLPAWPEESESGETPRKIDIKRPSETLAVLALIVPLVGTFLFLPGSLGSETIEIAVGFAIVLLTATLLSIDAAMLGRKDVDGKDRGNPGFLFLGMLLLWIVFYPLAYFRRTYFGRSNFGILAIFVALFFVASPFIGQMILFGDIFSGKPPACNSPEVVELLKDTLRNSPVGSQVKAITGHKEIRYDSIHNKRYGQCIVQLKNSRVPVKFTVSWVGKDKKFFQIQLADPPDFGPPGCNNIEVVALVENLIKDRPRGWNVNRVDGFRETHFDKTKEIRYGQCFVHTKNTKDEKHTVSFKVRWLNKAKGQFQVQIMNEPG